MHIHKPETKFQTTSPSMRFYTETVKPQNNIACSADKAAVLKLHSDGCGDSYIVLNLCIMLLWNKLKRQSVCHPSLDIGQNL